MPRIRIEFSSRVSRVLNPTGESWHPLASSVLMMHMDARMVPIIYDASIQAVADYFFLVGFAVAALLENKNVGDADELIERVRRETNVIGNVAHHAPLAAEDRECISAYAHYARDELQMLIDASPR